MAMHAQSMHVCDRDAKQKRGKEKKHNAEEGKNESRENVMHKILLEG